MRYKYSKKQPTDINNLKLFKIVNVSWLFFRIFVPHGGKTEFELTHITKFSETLLIWSPPRNKNLTVLTVTTY